jgi:parallel beta-helix repeat protein
VPLVGDSRVAIILLLILCLVITIFPNVEIVKAESTIYIRADGTVDGKIQRDENIYTLTDNIYCGVVVEKDNIIIDGAGYAIQGESIGINLTHRSNVTVRNVHVKTELSKYGYATGIFLRHSSNIRLIQNSITVPYNPQEEASYIRGISLSASPNNTISKNTITLMHKDRGLSLDSVSNGNIVSDNRFINCGITTGSALKNFVNNTLNDKPIVYLEDAVDQIIQEDAGQVILMNCNNITAENLVLPFVGIQLRGTNNTRIVNNQAEISLEYSNGNLVSNNNGVINVHYSENNTFSKNTWWINLFYAYNSTIFENTGGIQVAFSANISIVDSMIDSYSYIKLQDTVYCIIDSNNLTGNGSGDGIILSSSHNNTIVNNVIANRGYGVYLRYSSHNLIYGNSFINNTAHVGVWGSLNFWDDGTTGNYWSNYRDRYPEAIPINGVWSIPYGIVDPAWVNASNQDNYPLVAPIINIFDAGTWEGIQYYVRIISNSTVSDFSFNHDSALIRFDVEDVTGTSGFCRVTIPRGLLDSESIWIVLVDGYSVTPTVNEDTSNSYIYITYSHSTKTIEIIGTDAIPEFPSWAPLMFMLVAVIIVAVIYRRRIQNQGRPKP